MEKYYKNFILCGEIDYYCVLCQEEFWDESDVSRHMRWEKHRNALKLQEYLHKYKKDLIYKIDDTYYCEICNLITPKPAEHVKDNVHRANKATEERNSKESNLVKRETDGTIKVNNKTVSYLEWHGCANWKCSLCDTNLVTFGKHCTSATHMSNLTQSCVKCEEDMCYRQLNSHKFWCFTCCQTFDNKLLTSHWNDKHNVETVETITIPKETKATKAKETSIETKPKTKTNNKKCDTNNNVSNWMIECLAQSSTVNKHYKVNIKEKTAQCLHCNAMVQPSFKAFDKHTDACHPDEKEEEILPNVDAGKRRHELAVYASQNYIKLNEGGSKTFCTLCNVFTSAHINCARSHVEGSKHRGHLEIKGLITAKKHAKPPVKDVQYKSFLEDTYGPFHIDKFYVKVLNDGICLDVLSYEFIKFSYGFERFKGKCFACDVKLGLSQLDKHLSEKGHKEIVLKCKVVLVPVKDDSVDFIREIHPGLYHCGYCNVVSPFWEKMEKHLNSFTHKVQRTKKNLLSMICAKIMLYPHLDLCDIEEYIKLRELDCFN